MYLCDEVETAMVSLGRFRLSSTNKKYPLILANDIGRGKFVAGVPFEPAGGHVCIAKEDDDELGVGDDAATNIHEALCGAALVDVAQVPLALPGLGEVVVLEDGLEELPVHTALLAEPDDLFRRGCSRGGGSSDHVVCTLELVLEGHLQPSLDRLHMVVASDGPDCFGTDIVRCAVSAVMERNQKQQQQQQQQLKLVRFASGRAHRGIMVTSSKDWTLVIDRKRCEYFLPCCFRELQKGSLRKNHSKHNYPEEAGRAVMDWSGDLRYGNRFLIEQSNK